MTVSAAELRRRLVGTEPLSLRAHLVLLVAAALLGAALSAAVFVGVWRRSATESVQAQAAHAEVRRQLALAQAQLRSARRALVATAAKRAAAERELALLRRADARAAKALAPQLAAATQEADALAHSSATLASALKSLQGYVGSGGTVDPGFVSTQAAYLARANRAAQGDAATLRQRLDDAARAAAAIGGR